MTDTPDRHGLEPDEATRELDQEPSIDAMLRQFADKLGVSTEDGWGEIENAGKALQKQRQEASRVFKQEANVFRDTFATPVGRKCLEIMLDMTVRTQPYPPDQLLPLDAITPLVLTHNAQCNFVWSILQAIARADNKETKPRTFET